MVVDGVVVGSQFPADFFWLQRQLFYVNPDNVVGAQWHVGRQYSLLKQRCAVITLAVLYKDVGL